jgi:1-acyl-sn-glycerol-3-phosphate acyltransferase
MDGDGGVNETRYAKIVEESRSPVLGLFGQALREDTSRTFPRVLFATFVGTGIQIPRAVMKHTNAEREAFVYGMLRKWAGWVIDIAQIQLEIHGAERIDPSKPSLFVANHSSPADIPVLFKAIPTKATFVANGFFTKIPIMRYWMRHSGGVFVDQGNPDSALRAFKSMLRKLAHGKSLILFPEGYIWQGEGLGEFKRGGIHAAILAHRQIVPICITGTDSVMRTGSMRIVPGKHVRVEFAPPIDPDTLSRAERKAIDLRLHDLIAGMKATGTKEAQEARRHPSRPQQD